MSKNVYERDFYLASDIDYIISKKIIEYDMRDAGFNLIKYFGLLSDEKIKYLERLSKSQRKIQIGLIQKYDKKFAVDLTKSFGRLRKIFFESNDLDDSDILSIKKDAIFVINKKCDNCIFENVEFAEKHVYTSFHKFNNIEMYYRSTNNSLDIKGINDELLYQHNEYFLTFLKKTFRLLESNDHKALVKYIKTFVNNYKSRSLDIRFYRDLSPDSAFILTDSAVGNSSTFTYGLDSINKSFLDDLDISYNYINYILPIIQRFYFGNIKV